MAWVKGLVNSVWVENEAYTHNPKPHMDILVILVTSINEFSPPLPMCMPNV